MSLNDLIKKIAQKRNERGFVTDPLKIHMLLTEEVGEIAAELKKLWSKNYDSFDKKKLAEELSDTFCLLAAMAHECDIDLEKAIQDKFFDKDEQRVWKTER
ncbi:MAG: hypothetical protein HN855_13230 [Anaerolineae bacterium]|jgi:NTP pyrophosphatase (non-canonical NTP hydrolase)|nr:hypothetical protein [Anaerolineae bacterium]MBT7072299.1 hypothetical protein [Anaerolineae bacterium]MBT7326116.1 hypothetical protein [Anaerolineae bacterium]MBT7601781.1 hypothetical protein [Anaerolineae bacterium]